MNADRRQEIQEIVIRIRATVKQVQQLIVDVDDVKEDETEAFAATPEALQSGDKGTAAEAAIENLDEASLELDNAESALLTAIDVLDGIE